MSENTNLSSTDKMKAVKAVELSEPTRPTIPIVSAKPAKPVVSAEPAKSAKPAMSVVSAEPAIHVPAQTQTRRLTEEERALRTRCGQLGVSVFFQEQTSVHSLGFTSAIPGEGKTFLARLTAEVMAEDNEIPVTLLECNWEHPTLSSAYDLAAGPGLSEWLLGRCPLEAIRRPVTHNLTIIPAGDNTYNATALLRTLQQRGIQSVLTNPDEMLIVDLPATVTTAYGPFAAQLVDTLILVVRMGVTPESFVTEAHNYLKNLSVHGVILNQVVSHLPRWLRRIL